MEFDKKQIKAIFITGISILLIVLLFLIFAIISVNHSNKKNKNINISTGFNSIQELVEHYNCKYKNDTYNKNREFPTEVNLVFAKPLYENYISNQDYYDKIIEDMASFLNYTNFKMIDTENDITIKVTCKEGKIYNTSINDIDDYFIYMDSQMELEKYQEIKTTSFSIDSWVLNAIIDNNWDSTTNFATRNSIFQNYNICFDEGIEYRKIGSKIYNVVFTDKYFDTVVNNIKVGLSFSSIKEILGKPTFEDDELKVIGYKGKDIYVFFTKNEISMYRCVSYEYDEFWKLVDKFLDDEYTFKEFMNELTYLWPDYSEYEYDSDYMFISYPNRGIDVKLNYEDISGIVLYNNFNENKKTIEKYLKHTEFVSRLQIDNVYEAEKRRITKENDLTKKSEDFMNSLKENVKDGEQLNCGKSEWFSFYMDLDDNGSTITTYFISKTGEFANRELNEPVYKYVWISDNYFVYSIYGKGIYCYNVEDGTRQALVQGNDNYNINSFENSVLTYDEDKTLELMF